MQQISDTKHTGADHSVFTYTNTCNVTELKCLEGKFLIVYTSKLVDTPYMDLITVQFSSRTVDVWCTSFYLTVGYYILSSSQFYFLTDEWSYFLSGTRTGFYLSGTLSCFLKRIISYFL